MFQNQTKIFGLSKDEKEVFLDLVKLFNNITRNHSIPTFLYGGTLLGFIRNGTMMPWDDDFDLGMSVEDRDKVENEIEQIVRSDFLDEFFILWDQFETTS